MNEKNNTFISCVFNGFKYILHRKQLEYKISSDFIWDFGKLPFPEHLGKYFIKIGKISAKIHEIGKIKAIFGLGMTPYKAVKMAK